MADGIAKRKKTEGILFQTSIIFGAFILITLVLSALLIYAIQMKEYKAQKVKDIRGIGDYLERLIQESGEDFAAYQDYYMKHFEEVDIPCDFSEYLTAQRKYESLLAQQPPSKDGKNFNFDSFSEEAKKAYFVYIHEYWILTFENARKTFNLPYTYYLVPKEDIYHMVYMIDGERTPKGAYGQKSDEGEYLYLGDEYYDAPEKYQVQWKTWFTGERQNDFEVWDNQWGHTYAYYTPLIINGRKLGLIGTEIEVATVNKVILFTSLKIAMYISLALVACFLAFMFFISNLYIKKLVLLESQIREFSEQKDPAIVGPILRSVKGNNEISSLSRQFAAMISEIENYMLSLLSTKKELKNTKLLAEAMNTLANKDSLTGVRNRTAYDAESKRIEAEIAEGKTEVGLAMIDMNFLKRINDTYGHEKGSFAIKKLCQIVCNIFKHSPVFRIGGDEFVAILKNDDYQNADKLAQEFNLQMETISNDNKLKPWEQISAALGLALFDSKKDATLNDVFKRADFKMYMRKKEMKGLRD